MKYKLEYDNGDIAFEGQNYYIYRESWDPNCGGAFSPNWPNGFWNKGGKRGFAENYAELQEEYFSHRDEYIAEATKLLIKERL